MQPTLYSQLQQLQRYDDALVREFQGKSLSTLRTPAFVIDRAIFTNNCARMHEAVNKLGISFRAHLKTHKVHMNT